MMSKHEVQQLVVARLHVWEEGHPDLWHTDGLLRGLVWATIGEDPGAHITEDVHRIFTLLDIPSVIVGDRVQYTLEDEA